MNSAKPKDKNTSGKGNSMCKSSEMGKSMAWGARVKVSSGKRRNNQGLIMQGFARQVWLGELSFFQNCAGRHTESALRVKIDPAQPFACTIESKLNLENSLTNLQPSVNSYHCQKRDLGELDQMFTD